MRLAFSLVELSIVLVVLGLLTGGVLTGQSLIRAAELRKIVSSIGETKSSYETFRGRYFAIPGDIANATEFWGELSSCPAGGNDGSTATCNGDGDGRISSGGGGHEHTRVWQHLANAGLIRGEYAGRRDGNTQEGLQARVVGTTMSNFPVLWGNSGYSLSYYTEKIGQQFGFALPAGSYLRYGSTNAGALELGSAITTVQETWNLDKKIDDGKALSGRLFVLEKHKWYNDVGVPSCVNVSNTEYNFLEGEAVDTSARGPGCAFWVKWD